MWHTDLETNLSHLICRLGIVNTKRRIISALCSNQALLFPILSLNIFYASIPTYQSGAMFQSCSRCSFVMLLQLLSLIPTCQCLSCSLSFRALGSFRCLKVLQTISVIIHLYSLIPQYNALPLERNPTLNSIQHPAIHNDPIVHLPSVNIGSPDNSKSASTAFGKSLGNASKDKLTFSAPDFPRIIPVNNINTSNHPSQVTSSDKSFLFAKGPSGDNEQTYKSSLHAPAQGIKYPLKNLALKDRFTFHKGKTVTLRHGPPNPSAVSTVDLLSEAITAPSDATAHNRPTNLNINQLSNSVSVDPIPVDQQQVQDAGQDASVYTNRLPCGSTTCIQLKDMIVDIVEGDSCRTIFNTGKCPNLCSTSLSSITANQSWSICSRSCSDDDVIMNSVERWLQLCQTHTTSPVDHGKDATKMRKSSVSDRLKSPFRSRMLQHFVIGVLILGLGIGYGYKRGATSAQRLYSISQRRCSSSRNPLTSNPLLGV